jgi:uncharacterized membrane protein YraQ (UPF0718 family)
MRILIGLLMTLIGTLFYIKGETYTKWLGKSNKNWKYFMGVPIGLLGALSQWSWIPLLCILTYLIFGECLPYGVNHWWTKLIGNRIAVTLNGIGLGLASFPITHWWCLLAGLVSGGVFYYLDVKNKKIQEPWVAIIRGLGGTIWYV